MPEVVCEPIRCEAFPDGIPGPIFDREANHVFAFHGDHGSRFEPVDPARVGEAASNAFLQACTLKDTE